MDHLLIFFNFDLSNKESLTLLFFKFTSILPHYFKIYRIYVESNLSPNIAALAVNELNIVNKKATKDIDKTFLIITNTSNIIFRIVKSTFFLFLL